MKQSWIFEWNGSNAIIGIIEDERVRLPENCCKLHSPVSLHKLIGNCKN